MGANQEAPRLSSITIVEEGTSLAVQLAGKLLSDLGCRVVRRSSDRSDLPISTTAIEWIHEGKEEIDRVDEIALQSPNRPHKPMVLLTDGRRTTTTNVEKFTSIVRVIPEEDGGFRDIDSFISAKTGVMWSSKEGFSARPRLTKLAIPSVFSALVASIAVVASSIRFIRTRLESDVLVTLERATLLGIGALGISVDGKLGAGGASRDRWGKGLYKCKDGRWVQLCTERPKFIEWLGRATGNLDDWLASGFLDQSMLAKSPALRDAWRDELRSLFSTRNAEEWEWVDPRIPLTAVNVGHELNHSVLVQNDLIGEEPEFKPAASLIHFAPRSEVLAPKSSRKPDSEDAHDVPTAPVSSLPLDGITVSDCGSVLAAPVAGRMLSDLGATVTKAHLPGTDMSDLRYWIDVNRGKLPQEVDFREPQYKQTFEYLLDADVLIHNFTSEAQEAMGVNSHQFFQRNPGGIYGEISAYGDDVKEGGQRRGYEVNVQASFGLMDFDIDGKPSGQPLMVNDYATGLALSLGILAGVYGRYNDGQGTAVYGSLARTAALWRATALGHLSDDGLTLKRFDGGETYLAEHQEGWMCYEPGLAAVTRNTAIDETPPSPYRKTRTLRMDAAISEALTRNDGRRVSYVDEDGRRISLSGAPWSSSPQISRSEDSGDTLAAKQW